MTLTVNDAGIFVDGIVRTRGKNRVFGNRFDSGGDGSRTPLGGT
jgi:hypothetical protein